MEGGNSWTAEMLLTIRAPVAAGPRRSRTSFASHASAASQSEVLQGRYYTSPGRRPRRPFWAIILLPLQGAGRANQRSGGDGGIPSCRMSDAAGPPCLTTIVGLACAMSNVPPESRALRREVYVALIAFAVGFVVVLSVLGWLIVRFVTPEARWWDVLHTSITAIMISVVFGGLGSAALSVWAMSRYHYWRGFYRCRFCGRPLKGPGILCGCPEAQSSKRRASEHDA